MKNHNNMPNSRISYQITMSSRRNRGGSGGNSSSNGANSSSSPSVRADLLDLSRHLRQERLFVNHEKSQLEQVRQSPSIHVCCNNTCTG